MNIYFILTLAALIFYVQIAVVVLKEKRDRINWIVAILAVYMALYAVYQAFLYSPSPKETVILMNTAFQLAGCASVTVGLFSISVLEIATKAWNKPYRLAAGVGIVLITLVSRSWVCSRRPSSPRSNSMTAYDSSASRPSPRPGSPLSSSCTSIFPL